MKKALSFWSLPMDGSVTVKEGFEWAKNAGFAGVELLMLEDGLWGVTTSTPEKEILELSKRTGVDLASMTLGPGWCKHLLTSKAAESRKLAVHNVERMIESCHRLGIGALLAVNGAFDLSWADPAWEPCTEFLPYDEAYDAALDGFKQLAPIARDAGVIVAVENISGFMSSPLEYRNFIDSIGSEFVQSFFDIGNVASLGDPVDWIYVLNKRIRNIHIKDYRRNGSAYVDLLAGDCIDWPRVRKALLDINYSHYVIAEMIPPYTYYPDQLVYNTSASLTRILEGQ